MSSYTHPITSITPISVFSRRLAMVYTQKTRNILEYMVFKKLMYWYILVHHMYHAYDIYMYIIYNADILYMTLKYVCYVFYENHLSSI